MYSYVVQNLRERVFLEQEPYERNIWLGNYTALVKKSEINVEKIAGTAPLFVHLVQLLVKVQVDFQP